MQSIDAYQLELAKHRVSTGRDVLIAADLSFVRDLDLAAPLLVAAYAEKEDTPRFVAVVEQV